MLDILLRKLYIIPCPVIKVSVSCFLLGTFLVFMGRSSTTTASTTTASQNISSSWAVITVLLSGFFLSSRNVMKKIIHCREGENSITSGKTAKIHSDTASVTSKVLEGIRRLYSPLSRSCIGTFTCPDTSSADVYATHPIFESR